MGTGGVLVHCSGSSFAVLRGPLHYELDITEVAYIKLKRLELSLVGHDLYLLVIGL